MIGIIGAMDIEVSAIKLHMTDIKEKQLWGIKFTEGMISGNPVVVALSGIGKVNAAKTATVLALEFKPRLIINIGTAGGMIKEENTLDIVIAEKIVQYDFDTRDLDGDKGIGIHTTSSKKMVELSKKVLVDDNHKVWVGSIASGDKFVSDPKLIAEIKKENPEVIACDMESGAISQVANSLEIPCIIIRSLSDIVEHEKNEMDFMTYAKTASKRSANYVEALIRSL